MANVPRRSGGGPEEWIPLPLDKGLFANLDPEAVVAFSTAMENAFVNELGGISRFPGLEVFATLKDNGRVYLGDFEGDLIAATSKGQIYRISSTGNVTACTGAPVTGSGRVIMAPTDKEMLFAAGGPVVRLRQTTSEVLSTSAENAFYVGWIDGFALAPEAGSLFTFYSNAGDVEQWPAGNNLQANSNPDAITTMLINPFREIMLGGGKKFEQWERLTTGNVPFFRRWSIGDGPKVPYVTIFADNTMWTINSKSELVKFLGQRSENDGRVIGRLLENIDDWSDAWMGGYPDQPLHIVGQKFILFQAPNATNEYGTKGVTIVYDYANKKFCTLYGWDNQNSTPTRWPGWSHWPLWGNVFVGGEGVIYKLTTDTFFNSGTLSRWLVRTAHIAQGNAIQIKNFRLRCKRGIGTPTSKATIQVRCRRDARAFGPWIKRDLGFAGDNIQFKEFGPFGTAGTFMWEIACSDDAAVNLIAAEVKAVPIGH